MALDNALFIAELSPSDPQSDDPVGEGDNHIRTVKTVLANTFIGDIGGGDTYDSVNGAVLVGPTELNTHPARLVSIEGSISTIEGQLSGTGAVTIENLTVNNDTTMGTTHTGGRLNIDDGFGGIALQIRSGSDIQLRRDDNNFDWRIRQVVSNLDFYAGDDLVTPALSLAKVSAGFAGTVIVNTHLEFLSIGSDGYIVAPTNDLFILSTLGDVNFSANGQLNFNDKAVFSEVIVVGANAATQGLVINGRTADDIGGIEFYGNDTTTLIGHLQGRQTTVQLRAYNSRTLELVSGTVPGITLDGLTTTFGGNVTINLETGNAFMVKSPAAANNLIQIDTTTAVKESGIVMLDAGAAKWQVYKQAGSDNLSFFSYTSSIHTLIINATTNHATFAADILMGGTFSSIYKTSNTQSFVIGGGNSNTAGANTVYYGGAHGSLPNVTQFRRGTTVIMTLDNANNATVHGSLNTDLDVNALRTINISSPGSTAANLNIEPVANGLAIQVRLGGQIQLRNDTNSFDWRIQQVAGDLWFISGADTANYALSLQTNSMTIGTTGTGNAGTLFTDAGHISMYRAGTASGRAMNFSNANGLIGGINMSGVNTAFVETSDPDLKTAFTKITTALERIRAAHDAGAIGETSFLSEPENKRWMYNAQWLGENQPNTGGFVRDDQGSAMMDYGKRTPTIEAGLFELLLKVEALEKIIH